MENRKTDCIAYAVAVTSCTFNFPPAGDWWIRTWSGATDSGADFSVSATVEEHEGVNCGTRTDPVRLVGEMTGRPPAAPDAACFYSKTIVNASYANVTLQTLAPRWLSVKLGDAPGFSSIYNPQEYAGSRECLDHGNAVARCSFIHPENGTWYVRVDGGSSMSEFTLSVTSVPRASSPVIRVLNTTTRDSSGETAVLQAERDENATKVAALEEDRAILQEALRTANLSNSLLRAQRDENASRISELRGRAGIGTDPEASKKTPGPSSLGVVIGLALSALTANRRRAQTWSDWPPVVPGAHECDSLPRPGAESRKIHQRNSHRVNAPPR